MPTPLANASHFAHPAVGQVDPLATNSRGDASRHPSDPGTGDTRITLITVCLNSRDYIEETILSVRGQSYRNIEYVVIDGGSTDGTQDVLRRHERDIDYWLSAPDRGISDAFNKGVLASTGEVIGFINSQDYYVGPEVVAHVAQIFCDRPDLKIVYGKTYYVPVASREYVGVMGERFSRKKMAKRNIMPHQSVFVRREIFEEFGLFRLDYAFAMDYEHLLRATRVHAPHFLDEGLAVMRLGGISDTRKVRVCAELYRAQRDNGAPLWSSTATLLYHLLTSAGLSLLRKFGVYTLEHLCRKLGRTRNSR